MATPELVTVTGRVMIDKATPDAEATIDFYRSVYLRHDDGTVYEPATVSVKAGADGAFSVSLMKGTDPAWAPVGWSYEITIKPKGTGVPYKFSAIVDGTTSMSFGDLVPLSAPAAGQTFILMSSRSAPGGVAGLDADGDVIDADGLKLSPTPAWTAIAGKPSTFTPSVHTHPESQVMERVCDLGEFVLKRGDVTSASPATTGNLWVTHFTAIVTETILTIRTNTGGASTTAAGATHAWVGVLAWDGTQYTPLCVSADDPTLWTAQFANYDTQVFAVNGSGQANLAAPGFNKVAGQKYAFFVLWIGAGQAPSLPAGAGNYADSLVEPRTNGWIGAQSAPPGSIYQGAWFAPDSRRFQGFMKR